MADRRMFSRQIIDSDAFLDMPLSTQALYFHLSMRADDEGFINNAKKIMRMIGAGEDELKVLITKKFIIPFDTGIIVVKHWKIHNYIRNDRLKETNYTNERKQLNVKDNGAYTLTDKCQSIDRQMSAQDSIGEDSIGKDILKAKFEEFRKLYPGTKRGLNTEFENLKKKHKDYKEIIPLLNDCLNNQIESRRKKQANKEFVPEWKHLKTYINNRSWEEYQEFQQAENKQKATKGQSLENYEFNK